MTERSQWLLRYIPQRMDVLRLVALRTIMCGLLGLLGLAFPLGAQQPRVAVRSTADDARRVDELLSRPVTTTLRSVSLEQAIDSIARIAQVFVQYPAQILRAHQTPVTIQVTAVPLGVVFERVLDGTNLRVISDGRGDLKLVSVEKSGIDSVPALEAVTGRVVDSTTGRGLSGVIIKVVGTKIVTTTSDSGYFTIRDVPAGNSVLAARLFGYKPVTRLLPIANSQQVTARIAMVPVSNVLTGVVTTATGLQRKIEVGNDITSLNVDSLQQVAPITSVTDLLETRVPGLTVLHSSGEPGAPSRLRLRGAGSITENNDPIVIVDGIRVYASQSDDRNNNLAPVQRTGGGATSRAAGAGTVYAAPSPLDQIDPSSIATIEVFKGPSASALYGSDAASGVIVITTKHGHDGPTHWNLGLGQGVNWLPGSWPTNYYRFGYDPTFGVGPLCPWNDLNCTVDSVVAFQALNDPRYSVFAHGSDQTANLTVTGGVATLQYSLTGSVAGDVGNLKLPAIEVQRYQKFYGPIPGWMKRPDNYRRWSVNGSLTAQPAEHVQVTLQSSLFNSDQQTGSLQSAISQLEGQYIDPTTLDNIPLITSDVERATAGSLTATNSLTLNWRPVSWLPLTAQGGFNTIQRSDQTYIPYGVNTGGIGLSNNGYDTTGSYGFGRGTSHDQTVTLGTAIPFFREHVTLALGGNAYSQSTADFRAYTNQLAPGVTVPTSFPTVGDNVYTFFGQTTSGTSTYGWYIEPRLNVASRFFVSPGFRLDGGSASGAQAGLSALPKIDLSYVAVDRQSQPPLWGFLTLLRPRVAFGYAGTQPGPADRLRLIGSCTSTASCTGADSAVSIGSAVVPVFVLSTLGNTQLRPERSSELEGGADATFWQGRLSLTYTQYNKTRHDAILSVPVGCSVFGCGASILKNIGVVRNTGTELSLDAQVLQRRALSWHVGANLSNTNDVVVRLNPGQQPFCTDASLTGGGGDGLNGRGCVVPGYPLFSNWVRPIASFLDLNHNGIIEPNEIILGDSSVYAGQPSPKYQLNLNSDLTLFGGRLSVHATFAYQNGLTQINQGGTGSFGLIGNAPNVTLAEEAAVIAMGGPCAGAFTFCYQGGGSTPIGVIQTVNTFRFNDLSINYEVPRAFSAFARVPRMTVALQGANLGLHTNYRGKDPNVNAFSTASSGDEAADLGQIPVPRTWWLKISMGN